MLNAEFVKAIGENAAGAAGLQVIEGTGSEQGRYFRTYDRQSKEVRMLRRVPPPRRDTVQRVKDVVSLVSRRVDERPDCVAAEVYVGDNAIVGVLTEVEDSPFPYREERVTMPLHVNPAFAALTKLSLAAEPKWMTHGAFVEFLRVEMAGCMNLSDFTLWRKLKFSANTGGASNIKAGNESMDRSVQLGTFTEGGVEIPEYIEFSLPVYDECSTVEKATEGNVVELRRWRVRCAVVVSTMKQEFALRPMTDEMEQARREAKQWLIDALAGLPADCLVVTREPS